MGFSSVLGQLLATLIFCAVRATATAAFTNSFADVTSGSSVSLTWDSVPSQYYPLCITAQVIDKTGDGFSANAYRANITTGASGTSYSWSGIPFPLRLIPGGLYQLELRPISPVAGEVPVLAKSPFFGISDPGNEAQPDGPAESGGGGRSDDSSGISKPVAIGVGVAIGVPSIAGTLFIVWYLRKRHRKAAAEKRRLKRSDFVIS
ncbi:uncharacterized protein C8A04DRAFT_36841 [Dichotomopilus funicola]|uniref:Uncharacterized protein n=1 Tax=Dichotomopilus funicola TaxID=1934379 RepID=A0AAN6V3L8_9PEZI|nr:hypothetical protein C8A04DRAFT_36841 [Dichotomopilus funicola]